MVEHKEVGSRLSSGLCLPNVGWGKSEEAEGRRKGDQAEGERAMRSSGRHKGIRFVSRIIFRATPLGLQWKPPIGKAMLEEY